MLVCCLCCLDIHHLNLLLKMVTWERRQLVARLLIPQVQPAIPVAINQVVVEEVSARGVLIDNMEETQKCWASWVILKLTSWWQ